MKMTMQIKSALLVSFCLFVSVSGAVKYEIEFPEKYVEGDDKVIDATFNDMPISRQQYLMNRIVVTGVVFDQVNLKDSEFMLVDSGFDLRKDESCNTSFVSSGPKSLPTFELEYGREPLEYLISMLKIKYGLDVKPNSSVGISNHYGYSLKSSGSEYLGSKMSDYNMDADDVSSLYGPLLGSFQSTAFNVKPNEMDQTNLTSTFDWSKVQDNDMSMIPVTNIVYMLNLEPAVEVDPNLAKFAQSLKFMDVAKEYVENPTRDETTFIISRAVLMENAISKTDYYGLTSSSQNFILL